MTEKKLSQFGRKCTLMNSVTTSFKTTTVQMIEMSQRKNMTEMSQPKRNSNAGKSDALAVETSENMNFSTFSYIDR